MSQPHGDKRKIENLGKSQIAITLEVPVADFVEYELKALAKMAKTIKIKGFRPGHAPLPVLRQQLDADLVRYQAQEIAIQQTYAKTVLEEKIAVISRPEVEILSEMPFKFKAVVAVMPVAEIKDRQKIKIPVEKVAVTAKDLEEVLAKFQERFTTYKVVERSSQKGDRVEIDFEGFAEDGKALPGTRSKHHPVIIGSETMIPGFEDELLGLKKDAEKEFKISFPKNYHHADFKGKKAIFKVKVHLVEEAIKPEMDTDLIKKISGKDQTLADFKKEIEENLLKEKEKNAKTSRENKYLEELLAKTSVDLPEVLIREEVGHILHEVREDIGRRGVSFEEFLMSAKTSIPDLEEKYRPEAEKRLKIRLALQVAIAEEGIEVSDSEALEELAKIKSYYPENQQSKIETDFAKGELGAQIKNRLSLRKFFAKVLE